MPIFTGCWYGNYGILELEIGEYFSILVIYTASQA
jgi:hypothetical protein